MDGYGLVLDEKGIPTGECKQCADNCNDCKENWQICSLCKFGYGLEFDDNGPTGKCASCPQNCSYCYENSKKCEECEIFYGFIRNNDGTSTGECGKCPDYCKFCGADNSKCTQCYSEYGYERNEDGSYTGKCKPCPVFCGECSFDSNWCTYCEDSFGFVIENNQLTNKCQSCSFKCDLCMYDNKICTGCIEGYGLEKDIQGNYIGTCAECPINCSECKYSDYCTKCDDGYKLENGKCEKCKVEHCKSCNNNIFSCKSCENGYMVQIDVNNIYKCVKCPDGCDICIEPSTCYSCGVGYYLTNENLCEKCIENCRSCRDSITCRICNDPFYASDDGKCVRCIENCQYCYKKDTCDTCVEKYYRNDDYKCEPCPENCLYCNDILTCTVCSPRYGFETVSEGRRLCMPCPPNCKNCERWSTLCEECDEGYELDINYRCRNPNITETIDIQTSFYSETSESTQSSSRVPTSIHSSTPAPTHSATPAPTPTMKPVYKNITTDDVKENGEYILNQGKDTEIGENEILIVDLPQIPSEGQNKLTNLVIGNDLVDTNLVVNIFPEYKELTITSESEKPKQLDIIQSGSQLRINLGESTFATIKEAKGTLEIGSANENKEVKLNQVSLAEDTFTLIPQAQVSIEQIDFNGDKSILVKSNNNQVSIINIKIQKSFTGTIHNAKIIGKVLFESSSSLNVNENVDITQSKLDLSYKEGANSKAPINGAISNAPSSIVVNVRQDSSILEQLRYLIAESSIELKCQKWIDATQINIAGSKLNELVCVDEKNANGQNAYRFYAQEKQDDDNKLGAGAIAGIVIACIVVIGGIIFALVYFLVIKKKRENTSSAEDLGGMDNEI
ncbi:hypothetical protein M9Y10_024996 [Tritrichomonas musculus]|uniref:EGF-like domain-containing protein n=1 Tax=Tritrichomonas musculus TaxID=1915356 RepID=A0ABR2HBT4_9EUKA